MFFFVIWKFIADIIQILFLKGIVTLDIFYSVLSFYQVVGFLNL